MTESDGATAATLRIREARRGDLPRLVALLSQLHEEAPEDYGAHRDAYEATFAEIAADPRQRLFVGEAGGDIVASGVLIMVPNLTHGGRPYAILENIVVDAAHRSRGYGEALVRRLAEEARAARCYKAALMSNVARKDAHRFYERVGFRFLHRGYRIDL